MSSVSKKSSLTKKKHLHDGAQSRTQHVVPENGRWAVKEDAGSSAATRIFDTQAEAIEAAKKKATGKNAEVIIHGRSGQVRQSLSKSRADDLMLRAWKGVHETSSEKQVGTRKAG